MRFSTIFFHISRIKILLSQKNRPSLIPNQSLNLFLLLCNFSVAKFRMNRKSPNFDSGVDFAIIFLRFRKSFNISPSFGNLFLFARARHLLFVRSQKTHMDRLWKWTQTTQKQGREGNNQTILTTKNWCFMFSIWVLLPLTWLTDCD